MGAEARTDKRLSVVEQAIALIQEKLKRELKKWELWFVTGYVLSKEMHGKVLEKVRLNVKVKIVVVDAGWQKLKIKKKQEKLFEQKQEENERE